jgi:hypothetical protein
MWRGLCPRQGGALRAGASGSARSAPMDAIAMTAHFWTTASMCRRLGDRRLCQIALPAPLRQCLASSAARFGANRTRFAVAASPSGRASCVRGMSAGHAQGLSPAMSMTRRRQPKQTRVLAYSHFLFAVAERTAQLGGGWHAFLLLCLRGTLSCPRGGIARHFCRGWATTQGPRSPRDNKEQL